MKTKDVISALALDPFAKASSALLRAKNGVISHRSSSSGPWWLMAVVVGDVVLHCRNHGDNHSSSLIAALARSRTVVSTLRKDKVSWNSKEGYIQIPPRTVNLKVLRNHYAKIILGRLFDKTAALSDGTLVNISDLAWEVALTTFAKKNSPSEFTEEQLHAKIASLPKVREFRQALHHMNNFKGTPGELVMCMEKIRSTSFNAVWRAQGQIGDAAQSKEGGKMVSLPGYTAVRDRVENGSTDTIHYGSSHNNDCIWTNDTDILPLTMWRNVVDTLTMYGFEEPKPFGLAVNMDNIPALSTHNQTAVDTMNKPLAALGKSSAPSIASALI